MSQPSAYASAASPSPPLVGRVVSPQGSGRTPSPDKAFEVPNSNSQEPPGSAGVAANFLAQLTKAGVLNGILPPPKGHALHGSAWASANGGSGGGGGGIDIKTLRPFHPSSERPAWAPQSSVSVFRGDIGRGVDGGFFSQGRPLNGRVVADVSGSWPGGIGGAAGSGGGRAQGPFQSGRVIGEAGGWASAPNPAAAATFGGGASAGRYAQQLSGRVGGSQAGVSAPAPVAAPAAASVAGYQLSQPLVGRVVAEAGNRWANSPAAAGAVGGGYSQPGYDAGGSPPADAGLQASPAVPSKSRFAASAAVPSYQPWTQCSETSPPGGVQPSFHPGGVRVLNPEQSWEGLNTATLSPGWTLEPYPLDYGMPDAPPLPSLGEVNAAADTAELCAAKAAPTPERPAAENGRTLSEAASPAPVQEDWRGGAFDALAAARRVEIPESLRQIPEGGPVGGAPVEAMPQPQGAPTEACFTVGGIVLRYGAGGVVGSLHGRSLGPSGPSFGVPEHLGPALGLSSPSSADLASSEVLENGTLEWPQSHENADGDTRMTEGEKHYLDSYRRYIIMFRWRG